ncbi:MAG: protein kinase [Cyanobacteria bacterium SZAS-4]|nr:protein kinase [Cyanobacteria bacterium SZAS-4]
MTPSDSHESTHFTGATEYGLSDAEYKHDDILGGRYRVISLLGRGGMGVVYRVEQIFLGKELALKTIDRQLMSDITVRRFQAEARAAFAVDHPNIVSVHDFGLFDDDTPFLVMEIVQGETLSDRLKRGTLSVAEATSIYIQCCLGLAHAHKNGVVHRDIKPGNIMLLTDVPEGLDTGVKILDFGIAKLAHTGEAQALTRTGEIFGSPLYMSPEQCSGGKADHRADVYSLGCVIFESLTGTPPYVGENALMTMMMHQTATIPTLKEGSLGAEFRPEFEHMIALMLAKNPDDRYQSLEDAANELSALKRGEAPRIDSTSRTKPALESRVGMVNINRDNFIYTMVGIGLTAFIISAWFTYFTQAANIQIPNPVVVAPVKIEPTTPINTSFEPRMNEESIIFDSGIMHGDNEFVSKMATDSSLKQFKHYPFAQVLDVQYCHITDDGIECLQDSKLLTLCLANCSIDSLNSLAKLPYIQNLDLDGTRIDDSSIPKIANLKMLHILSLADCNITEAGLRELAASPSLEVLTLTPKKFSPQFIRELYEKMPQCVIYPYRKTSKIQDMQLAADKKNYDLTLEKLIATAEKSNKNLGKIGALQSELATIRYHQGRRKEAQLLADKAVAQLERCGDLSLLPLPLGVQATIAVDEKDNKKALDLNHRGEQLFVDTVIHSSDQRLLPMLNSYTYIPMKLRTFDPAIEYCKTALNFIERFPSLDRDKKSYLIFVERIGYLYSMEGKYDLAIPYLNKNVDVTRSNKEKDPQSYMRALIEYAHALNKDYLTRKTLYKEAIAGLEKLGLPEDLNLKEHYCAACQRMSEILAVEHDYDGAALYARKGLEATAQYKHRDENNRRPFFIRLLITQLRAAGREEEASREMTKYGVKL